MTSLYQTLDDAVAAHGLALRGGFHPLPGDNEPGVAPDRATASVLMIGNVGPAMWSAFAKQRPDGPDPLDRWSRAVIGPLAERAGARAVYPFDIPPLPFQRWAARAWPLFASPLGLLIDADHGLWHALRGALLFGERLALPQRALRASPCAACLDKPCLSACPVEAFSTTGFDSVGCRSFLKTDAGAPCRDGGCKARDACPVGHAARYPATQIRFHMRAFGG